MDDKKKGLWSPTLTSLQQQASCWKGEIWLQYPRKTFIFHFELALTTRIHSPQTPLPNPHPRNGLSFNCKRSVITGSHGRTLYQLQHRPTLALSAIFWRALHEAFHFHHFWSVIFLWDVWVFSPGLSAGEVCLITPSNCMIPFTFLWNLWFSRSQHALTSQASASAMAVVLVKTNEEKLGVEGTRGA